MPSSNLYSSFSTPFCSSLRHTSPSIPFFSHPYPSFLLIFLPCYFIILTTKELCLKCFLIRTLTSAEPTPAECTVWTCIKTACVTQAAGWALPDYRTSIAGKGSDRDISPQVLFSLGSTHPPVLCSPGALSPGVNYGSVKLTTPLYSAKVRGKAVPLFISLWSTPWRRMGANRLSCINLDLGTRWRWVASFIPRPFYPSGKCPLFKLIFGQNNFCFQWTVTFSWLVTSDIHACPQYACMCSHSKPEWTSSRLWPGTGLTATLAGDVNDDSNAVGKQPFLLMKNAPTFLRFIIYGVSRRGWWYCDARWCLMLCLPSHVPSPMLLCLSMYAWAESFTRNFAARFPVGNTSSLQSYIHRICSYFRKYHLLFYVGVKRSPST